MTEARMIEAPRVDDEALQVCHYVTKDGAHGLCGVSREAWRDCPYSHYIGDYCKCEKPLCSLCEAIDGGLEVVEDDLG